MYSNKILEMVRTLLAHLKAAPDKTGMYVPFHKAQSKMHHQDRHRLNLVPSSLVDWFRRDF